MSKLTVLIPSIGRQSLVNAINSVPKQFPVEVLVTGADFPEMPENIRDFDYTVMPDRLGPGPAKQHLIDRCTSEYFVILDDDDEFMPGFLEACERALLDDQYCDWIQSGMCEEVTDTYKFQLINECQQLYDNYFEYDKYSTEYVKTHIYPNSTCIIRTAEFRKMALSFSENSYGDDVIPILSFLINRRGYYVMNGVTQSGHNDTTVSRRVVPIDEVSKLCTDITEKIITAPNVLLRDIWIRCYDNLVKRINHMNSKYGK